MKSDLKEDTSVVTLRSGNTTIKTSDGTLYSQLYRLKTNHQFSKIITTA